ncbi:MAG: O-antigen ligase family protein [Verrucomicrobiae bacterium]|nr:O-antigen ligase family protein [Verrucomicrobiae bacterium]
MNFRERCHAALEPLLLATVVFAPWAFGATAPWSERTLTVLGILLGLLALVARPVGTHEHPSRRPFLLAFGIGWIGFLLYVATSALNARATAELGNGGVSLAYRDCIRWLPHSYDAPRTWMALAKHLAVAGIFLATWRLAAGSMDISRAGAGRDWPPWLVRLLWVLSVSSAALAMVSIAQRLSGTNRLLFLIPRVLPTGHIGAQSSFGPYPYQSNGAQYFNLVWPLTLGFWWCQLERILKRGGARPRLGTSPLSLLPFLAALMIACPFVSTSRGGALVCLAQLAGVLGLLAVGGRRIPRQIRLGALGGVAVALGIAAAGDWSRLWARFERPDETLSGRKEIYAQARRMAKDFEPWGGGAESFRRLSDLYTDPGKPLWEAFVHNDWLEAHLSYGSVGLALLALLSGLWLCSWLRGPWLGISRWFSAFALLSLAGMLLHARFDLPFQILSLNTLFALIGAVLLATPPPWRRGGSAHRG